MISLSPSLSYSPFLSLLFSPCIESTDHCERVDTVGGDNPPHPDIPSHDGHVAGDPECESSATRYSLEGERDNSPDRRGDHHYHAAHPPLPDDDVVVEGLFFVLPPLHPLRAVLLHPMAQMEGPQ